jgi:HK97 family phage major capsid protein
MNFSTLIALLKMRDQVGHPVLHLKYDDKGNPLLLEKPVYICPSMPSIGVSGSPTGGNTPIAFGAFSRFIFRTVENTQMLLRATEMSGTAENLCVAYQGYLRATLA